MIVKKTRRIDVECVVRGYLAGSGWKEYQRDGTVCGIPLPPGLELNSPLPEPIFTPALKVDDGHDENVPYEKVVELYGPETAAFLRDTSIRLYEFAAAKAAEAGIILADTKLEFGRLGDEIIVIDELFTPDSSRFWPRDRYVAGRPIDSLDKQPVRDYLESIGWNKEPPAAGAAGGSGGRLRRPLPGGAGAAAGRAEIGRSSPGEACRHFARCT